MCSNTAPPPWGYRKKVPQVRLRLLTGNGKIKYLFTLKFLLLMISPFYATFNICKNYQLDEFYNSAALAEFLRQMPELKQTAPHHFSNSTTFGHYLSIALLCAAPNDNWFDESPESHATNLIVVVTSRLNNAPLFVKPILLKICRFLNWELIGDDEDQNTPDDIDDLDNFTRIPNNLNNPAPFRRLNEEEKEFLNNYDDDDDDNEDEEDDEDPDDEQKEEDDDNNNYPPFQFNPN